MPDKPNKITCRLCGELLPPNKYYKSGSLFYPEGKIPICKDCFARKYSEYNAKYHSTKKAMQRMCMAFDIYFSEDLFDQCDDNSSTSVGLYLSKLYSSKNKSYTFDNNLDEGFEFSGDRVLQRETYAAVIDKYGNVIDNQVDRDVSMDDIEKWGVGLSPEDYSNLNSHYKYLTEANPNCDNNQKIFIVDLCYAKMQQQRCIRERDMDNFKKMGDYYNSTFSKSGLQAANDTDTANDDCLGLWASRISQYTPEEYYKNRDLYKDHDNLREYFERFLLRPLRNLMHGTTDRDYEYYVKEENEGDTDEYADFDED